MSIIYKNDLIKIEIESSEIPWLKIFTIKELKEFSQCDNETKQEIFKYLDIIEKEMLDYFKKKKKYCIIWKLCSSCSFSYYGKI